MSLEELQKEREELDSKIAKLEGYVGKKEKKDILLGDYIGSGLEFIPEVLPVVLLPALMGFELYGEALECETLAGKIAMCALSTPLAVPCIGLSLILAAPFAIPTIALSAVMGGVQSTYAGAHNARLSKAEKKLKKLKAKREELEQEIQKTTSR